MTRESLQTRLDGFPRLSLARYPTPLQYLPHLSQELDRPIYVKRDDEIGPGLGGNKTRKLEYLLAEARQRRARKVATFGGLQSNHARITAAAARACGLEPHLFYFERKPPRLSGNLLLNDLFGIQSRGGCSCAGPYGHRLLGIDIETSHEFEREIARGCEGIKPGWVRVSFNYFISDAVFEFILEAVDLVASDGWRLTPAYTFDPVTGLWRHRAGTAEPPLSLRDVRYEDGAMRYAAHRHRAPDDALTGYLDEARRLLAAPPPSPAEPPALAVGPDFEELRWFWLPGEIERELASIGRRRRKPMRPGTGIVPFRVESFPRRSTSAPTLYDAESIVSDHRVVGHR